MMTWQPSSVRPTPTRSTGRVRIRPRRSPRPGGANAPAPRPTRSGSSLPCGDWPSSSPTIDAGCLPTSGSIPPRLDLLSVLRRAGTPYELTTRELADRTLVTAGAISQRVARAEQTGLVERRTETDGSRAVVVSLTTTGHDLVERTVDQVLTREADLVSSLSKGRPGTARRPSPGPARRSPGTRDPVAAPSTSR